MKALINDKQGNIYMILDNYKRLEYNTYKGIILLILFLVLSLKSCAVKAQGNERFTYRGITTSFGIRSYKLSSDIPQLNQMRVVSEGGSAGILFGNDFIQTRIHLLGFYYSAGSVPRTVNTFEAEGLVNYYPLVNFGLSNSRVQPYLVTGIAQDFMRFYGTYLNHPENTPKNNSIVNEPLAGSMRVTRATVGAGVQWNIPCEVSFVRLFAEARYGIPMLYRPDQAFSHTTIKEFMTVNVGVSFGARNN